MTANKSQQCLWNASISTQVCGRTLHTLAALLLALCLGVALSARAWGKDGSSPSSAANAAEAASTSSAPKPDNTAKAAKPASVTNPLSEPADSADYEQCPTDFSGLQRSSATGSMICSESLLDPHEVSDQLGKRIAKTYLAVEVRVTNRNEDYDYLLHDVRVGFDGLQ
jgi:hypothetical protein